MGMTINEIEKNGLLLYKYKRGSVAYGLNTPSSDIDYGGIYLMPMETLCGLGFDYCDEVKDEKGDITYFELNKFMRLILKSNPTVLEALFVDDEFVEFEHPIITELKKNRDKFVTKQCFNPFGAYAVSQIKKCRSLEKKMLQDEEKKMERRTALSFCYTFYNQGSTKIENWLAYRGLRADCCGLNKIPNMRDEYGIFYDWGQHWEKVGYDYNDAVKHYNEHSNSEELYRDDAKFCVGRYITNNFGITEPIMHPTIGYRGIFKDEYSTEVRLSSIDDKNDRPICHMSFNQDGFKEHCREYKDFIEWEKNRNPVRYAENKGKNFDAKNVSHSFRLMNMCIEIAKGEGFKVNRRGIDREFLLDVKQHKYEYDDIIAMLDKKKIEMDNAIAESELPEEIDINFVNDFVVKIRKEQLGIK